MIIGNSEEGPMIQCEACHTVYSQKVYDSCPHCWLRRKNDFVPDEEAGGTNEDEGWISI